MKKKINYYILIPKGYFERFYESINKPFSACLKAVKEFGDAFGMVAKELRSDKLSKAISDANEYVKEHEKII